MKRSMQKGLSLIELLLVLAIIGIITAVAIPSLSGQKDRAKMVGDAKANAKALAMILENRKAEAGTYGTAGTYNWTPAADSAAAALAPQFVAAGNSRMKYKLTLTTPLAYTLDVSEGSTLYYRTDQTGATLYVKK